MPEEHSSIAPQVHPLANNNHHHQHDKKQDYPSAALLGAELWQPPEVEVNGAGCEKPSPSSDSRKLRTFGNFHRTFRRHGFNRISFRGESGPLLYRYTYTFTIFTKAVKIRGHRSYREYEIIFTGYPSAMTLVSRLYFFSHIRNLSSNIFYR